MEELNKLNSPEVHNLSFEKRQHKEGVILYIFEHAVVAIDTTGKNYKPLPEISFATFDNKSEMDIDSLNQPETRREGVDMEYVSQCIEEVVKDTGMNEFWLYPHAEDKSEDTHGRKMARLRLFKRYADITPAPNDFGYVMKIPTSE